MTRKFNPDRIPRPYDPERARLSAQRIRDGEKPQPLFVPSKPVVGENVWL